MGWGTPWGWIDMELIHFNFWYWTHARHSLDPHSSLTFSPLLHGWLSLPCSEAPSGSTACLHKGGVVLDAAARTAATGTDARRHKWLGALRVTKETWRRPAHSLLGWDATQGNPIPSWSKKIGDKWWTLTPKMCPSRSEMWTNVISVTIHKKFTLSFHCKPPDFSASFDLWS